MNKFTNFFNKFLCAFVTVLLILPTNPVMRVASVNDQTELEDNNTVEISNAGEYTIEGLSSNVRINVEGIEGIEDIVTLNLNKIRLKSSTDDGTAIKITSKNDDDVTVKIVFNGECEITGSIESNCNIIFASEENGSKLIVKSSKKDAIYVSNSNSENIKVESGILCAECVEGSGSGIKSDGSVIFCNGCSVYAKAGSDGMTAGIVSDGNTNIEWGSSVYSCGNALSAFNNVDTSQKMVHVLFDKSLSESDTFYVINTGNNKFIECKPTKPMTCFSCSSLDFSSNCIVLVNPDSSPSAAAGLKLLDLSVGEYSSYSVSENNNVFFDAQDESEDVATVIRVYYDGVSEMTSQTHKNYFAFNQDLTGSWGTPAPRTSTDFVHGMDASNQLLYFGVARPFISENVAQGNSSSMGRAFIAGRLSDNKDLDSIIQSHNTSLYKRSDGLALFLMDGYVPNETNALCFDASSNSVSSHWDSSDVRAVLNRGLCSGYSEESADYGKLKLSGKKLNGETSDPSLYETDCIENFPSFKVLSELLMPCTVVTKLVEKDNNTISSSETVDRLFLPSGRVSISSDEMMSQRPCISWGKNDINNLDSPESSLSLQSPFIIPYDYWKTVGTNSFLRSCSAFDKVNYVDIESDMISSLDVSSNGSCSLNPCCVLDASSILFASSSSSLQEGFSVLSCAEPCMSLRIEDDSLGVIKGSTDYSSVTATAYKDNVHLMIQGILDVPCVYILPNAVLLSPPPPIAIPLERCSTKPDNIHLYFSADSTVSSFDDMYTESYSEDIGVSYIPGYGIDNNINPTYYTFKWPDGGYSLKNVTFIPFTSWAYRTSLERDTSSKVLASDIPVPNGLSMRLKSFDNLHMWLEESTEDQDEMCFKAKLPTPELLIHNIEKEYDGSVLSVSDPTITLVNNDYSAGPVIVTYYIDENCTTKTFADTDNAGTPPVDAGLYYARAEIGCSVSYTSAFSNIATVSIKSKPLTVTSTSATQVYNGSPLKAESVEFDGLVEGENLTITYTGEQTNVGSSENDFTCADGTTSLVSNYKISYVYGTLKVNPRQVTLTSPDLSQVFDGTALAGGEVVVGGDGFVAGEGVEYTMTGSQTQVGLSRNTFEYTFTKGTDADNYEITTSFGTLTVMDGSLDFLVHRFIFVGWDIDFSNVTSDLVVHATYREETESVDVTVADDYISILDGMINP